MSGISDIKSTSAIIKHPVNGDVLYRTNGNIKLDGSFQVATTSLPLDRMQKTFDDGFISFSDTLKGLFKV